MASSIQLLRSTIAQERPFPNNLLEGQPAVNLNASEPGLFFKAADGSLVKFGPAAITSDGFPPNSSPQGSSGNTVGELWLDKSVDPPVLKVYDGSAWIDAGSGGGGGGGGAGSFVRWVYTSIGGETSLSGSSGGVLLDYTPGLEEVFVNGVLITRGADYSAINGTSITNLAPLTEGDVVTVTSMNPLEVVQLPGQVTLLRWTVLAAAGQTVLSGIDSSSRQLAYTAGFEEVYVNGAFLRRDVDYSATNGSSITLAAPLALDDEVTVMAWSAFEVGSNQIDTDDIVNEAVTTAKIDDGAITDTKVSSVAAISSAKLSFKSNVALTPGEARSVESKLADQVSVLDFIPENLHASIRNGTNTLDLSSYVQAAINSKGKMVFFPAGRYLCNVYMGNTVLVGEGNMSSILLPFDLTIAAVTVILSAPFWTGHKEIRNLGFRGGNTGTNGIGVALGITDPMEIDVDAGATSNNPQNAKGSYGATFLQGAQSVKFYGCNFRQLDKGIIWSSGNIGSEIFGCGFQYNRYGVYLLSNKRGGGGESTGCKYFYGGEFSRNDCAVYMHNHYPSTGQIAFRDVVMEYNRVGFYLYTKRGMIAPFTVENMWQEGNGRFEIAQGPVTIDDWVDHPTLTFVQNRTTQVVEPRFAIFAGETGEYIFKESFVGDMDLEAAKADVYLTRCHIEGTTGCTGGPLTVFNPTTASFIIKDSWTSCGVGTGSISGVYAYQLKFDREINNQAQGASMALVGAPHRAVVADVYANNRVYSFDFTTPEALSGSFSLNGTVVSDGVLFPTCNEFVTTSFTTGQFLALTGSTFTTTEGYYVCTFTAKTVSGKAVGFGIWDRNQNQWFSPITAENAEGVWITYSSYAYSPGGQTLFFDVRGQNGDSTWRMSDLQVLRFDTERQALDFLSSRVFSHA